MTILGLARDVVRVVPYQFGWPRLFREEAERLSTLPECREFRLEHIGSTAVSGLPAKPIIDMVMAVPELPLRPRLIVALERSGYTHRGDGGVAGRAYFVKGAPDHRTHHLNLCVEDGAFRAAHITFRDHMRSNATDRRRYARLKLKLAAIHARNRPRYTEAKSSFVAEILGTR